MFWPKEEGSNPEKNVLTLSKNVPAQRKHVPTQRRMFWPKEECSGPKEEGSNPEKNFLTQRKNVPTYEDVSKPCSDLGRCSEAMFQPEKRRGEE